MLSQVTVVADEAAPPRRSRFIARTIDPSEFAARFLTGGLFLALSIRIGQNFLATGRITGLLLLASEFLVVVFTVIRRPAVSLDRRWHARAIVTASLVGPLLVSPTTAAGFLPDLLTAVVSAVGLVTVIAAKITLGRSFGLLPANRGIVCAGPYRFVRHPIYLAYLVTDAGFLLAHPTWWNILVLIPANIALVVRAVYEEATLRHDAAYAAYQTRVRWRILPGVF